MTRMCFSLQTFRCLFIISILSHIPNSNWEAAIQNAFTNSGHHYENTIQSVFLANKWSIYGKYSVLSVLHMSSIVFWQHDFSNDEWKYVAGSPWPDPAKIAQFGEYGTGLETAGDCCKAGWPGQSGGKVFMKPNWKKCCWWYVILQNFTKLNIV